MHNDDDIGGVFWDSKIQTLSERAELTVRTARMCCMAQVRWREEPYRLHCIVYTVSYLRGAAASYLATALQRTSIVSVATPSGPCRRYRRRVRAFGHRRNVCVTG